MDLQQQAQRLNRSMANREKRRARQDHNEGGDGEGTNGPRKKRTEPLRAAQQAYAAVMAAAALQPQPVMRCELCQASFVTDALLQQHLAGPVHRKAVEKAARAAEKQQHVNEHSAVAQEALAAAAWLGGGGGGGGGGGRGNAQAAGPAGHQVALPPGSSVRQQLQQPRKQSKQQQRLQPAAAEQLTHAQMLAQAKQHSEPLTLDGWVPPTIPAVKQQQQPPPQQGQELALPMVHQQQPTFSDAVPATGAAAHEQQQQPQPQQHGTEVSCPGKEQSPGSNATSSSDGAGDSEDDDDDVPQTFESFF